MFSVPHLVIIFIVVLVVFGPHKLPELARGLGKMMAEFRKASTDFKLAFEEEMRNIERQAREAELKKIQDAATTTAPAEQPATLATSAESERLLPPTVEPIEPPLEPTIAPVSEAIAREPLVPAAPVVFDAPPITEGTAPANGGIAVSPPEEISGQEDSDAPHVEPENSSTHDQRRPA
jgi:sec-independent protein translocase protein TatB